MPSEYVMGLDIGTSTVRCLITGPQGRRIALASQPWSYETPEDLAPTGHEFNPEQLWRQICAVIKEAMANAGIKPEAVRGVSAASQREGAVFLDGEGKELYAGPNIDLRALFEGIAIDNDFGDEIYKTTGHKPSLLLVPARLKWFMINNPEVYRQISSVMSICDWVGYKLSGELSCELSSACELGLVDINTRKWAANIINKLDLPGNIYPGLANAGSKIGTINARASAETGLDRGTIVASGAADTQSGLLGLGINRQDMVGVVAGWSAPVQMVTAKPVLDKEQRVWTSCHALENSWILESNTGEAGNAYRWLKENLLGDVSGYDIMDEMAQSLPPGSEGAMALIGPDLMNMDKLGLRWGGILFPLPLSFSQISRNHVVRAVLENLCYAIKANRDQLEQISAIRPAELYFGGGLSQSRVLSQILSDVLNRPVLVPADKEVTALGAAMCAAAGAGFYSSPAEAVTAMKGEQVLFLPDAGDAAEYEEYYQKWQIASRRMEALSQELQ